MAIRAEHIPALPREPIAQIPEGLRIAYAQHLLNKHLRKLRARLNEDVSYSEPLPQERLSHSAPSHGSDEVPEYKGRVAIVGAGATGLYLAMMLKYLKINNVDIYEASDRIGGRCYTYSFPDDKDCPHNYYDIGAMRIPEIPAMQSTLNLIKELDLPKTQYVLNAGCEPQMHYYSNDPADAPSGKPYEDRIVDIIAKLSQNWNEEFEALIDGNDDDYSTRAWLMHTDPKLTYEQTEEAESAETSTGLFDQAFIESLCDYSDFQAANGKPWWRLEGGMSIVTDKMNKCIEDPNWVSDNPISLKVKTKTPVVTMSESKSGDKIEVTLAGATKPESYDMVFNTTAMGPLQRMDIAGLVPGFGLPGTQKKILTGIRALSYDRACKVAIKFKTRWWKDMYKTSTTHDTIGGVSGTDLSISNVVYPSWDDGDKAAVLMVSYSWAQDATRMGALIPDYSKQKPCIDDTVVKQSFQDLVRLWSESDPTITVDFLTNQYVTHHAYAWSHDLYTGGAFALFGPGQFKYMYPEFQHILCGGKFAICGEALSPHHAWISGALDSGYLTMVRWLGHLGDHKRIEALKKSWFGAGKNEHTAEFDEVLMYWSVKLSKEVAKELR
ncbi:uncharacterized protein B0J16DRAFT_289896 [Fusarium flagelliforme]|uniref:uncharacterized protein n=1 Tax=Fusarium flagelliforme TaxID=2675880 RepID=UPI001E8D5757|nr:uncharacterized protein B0J16DRAFT_289896 [Fusarium flagelliforme]KAH7183328.1 hypothetical protein B0J16DRAFT_289896 [Fusarium flagelliforme]